MVRSFIHRFTPEVGATTSPGPDQSQDLELHAVFPCGRQGPIKLARLPLPSHMLKQGAGLQVHQLNANCCP